MANPEYDLCIVGAGMFGSAAARHASAFDGVKVCLIDAGEPKVDEFKDREIFGAHYDEGRIIRISDDNILTQSLSKSSISRCRELERLSGIPFYDPVGFLLVSKKNSPFMKKILQISEITGLSLVDLSYGNILKKRFPFLKFKSDDQVVLEDSGAGYISPRKMIVAQKKVALNQGCTVIEDVAKIIVTENDGSTTIMTTRGVSIKSQRVLFCMGAFTNLQQFSIPKLEMRLQRETVAMLRICPEEAARLGAMPPIIYCRPEEFDVYILPPIKYPDGYIYLKIGHMDFEPSDSIENLEDVAQWYRSAGNPEKVKYLSEILIQILPGLKYEDCITKTCVTCDSPSGQPYIDRLSPTVTVAAVGNGRGAKFADEVGRIAATLSVTGKWDSALAKSNFEAIFKGS